MLTIIEGNPMERLDVLEQERMDDDGNPNHPHTESDNANDESSKAD